MKRLVFVSRRDPPEGWCSGSWQMRGHHVERCTRCRVPRGICIYSVTHKTTPYALGDEARSYLFHQTPRQVGLSRAGTWLRVPCTQMGLVSMARHRTGLAVTRLGHLSSSAVTSLSKTAHLGEGQVCRRRSRGSLVPVSEGRPTPQVSAVDPLPDHTPPSP